MDERIFCQSCGMPMTEAEHFGTKADGSLEEDYCTYCYQNGAFTNACTMDEMIDFCVNMGMDSGMYQDREEATKGLEAWFPTLKRWKQAD